MQGILTLSFEFFFTWNKNYLNTKAVLPLARECTIRLFHKFGILIKGSSKFVLSIINTLIFIAHHHHQTQDFSPFVTLHK